MTRLFSLFCLLCAGLVSAQTAPPARRSAPVQPTSTNTPAASPFGHRVAPPSLLDDSVRAIQDGGFDLGGMIAERRARLVQASLQNPYFWFCTVSVLSISFLLITVCLMKLSEQRKIWKATGVMTDLWNWALFADYNARQAIDKYNTHIEKCNRLAELEASGKKKTNSQTEEEKKALAELDSLRRNKAALEEDLQAKEKTIRTLTERVDKIEQRAPSVPAIDIQTQARLMETNKQLAARNQELEEELEILKKKKTRLPIER